MQVVWQALGTVVAVLVVVIAWQGLNLRERRRYRRFPGPKPSFLLGNAPGVVADGYMAFRSVQRWRHEHGPVFVWWWGTRPLLVVSDPEIVRQVAVRGFKSFHDRELLAPAPQGRVFERLVSEGVIFGKGGYWLSVRAAVQPLFHAASLPSYCGALNAAIEGSLLGALDLAVAAVGGVKRSLDGGKEEEEEQQQQRPQQEEGGREGGGGGIGGASGRAPCSSSSSVNMSARICDLTLKALGECVFGVPFEVGGPGGAAAAAAATTKPAAATKAADGTTTSSSPSSSSSSSSSSPLVAAAHAALEGQITGMAFGLAPPLLRPALFALVRAVPTPGLARLAAARRVLCGVALVLSRNARAAAAARATTAAAATAAAAAPPSSDKQQQQAQATAGRNDDNDNNDDDEEERRDLRAMEREFFGRSSAARLAAAHYGAALPRRGSALDCLSRAKNRAERGRPLRLRHLVAQANSLLIAGHDTNGMALSAALLFLSTHPEAEAALIAEVDGFYEGAAEREREEARAARAAAARAASGGGDGGEGEEEEEADEDEDDPGARYLESSDVAGACFPYAEAVIKEAVRLLPPGWMTTRLATATAGGAAGGAGAAGASDGGGSSFGGSSFGGSNPNRTLPEIAGVPVPDGTLVYLDVWGVHHHPDYWPEPLAFRPERFLGWGAGSAALCSAAAAAAEAAAATTRAGGRLPTGWTPSSSSAGGGGGGGGLFGASLGGGGGVAEAPLPGAGGGGLSGGGAGGQSHPNAPPPQVAATGGGVGASSAGAHPYAWLGFGAGPRLCVGYKFAMMEAKCALVRLYRQYTLRVDETLTPLSATNWEAAGVPHTRGGTRIPRLRPGVTLGFRDPLWMVPVPRERRTRARRGSSNKGAAAAGAAEGAGAEGWSEGGGAAATVVVRVVGGDKGEKEH